MFDWGTHWFDMFFFYNDETPAEWLLGQVEPRGGATVFGVQMEAHGIAEVGFANGITGILATSKAEGWPLSTRIVGTDGFVEAALRTDPLRKWTSKTSGWEIVDLEGDGSLQGTVATGVVETIQSLVDGVEPELSSHKVIRATELIFATYESSRRGTRIDLPLDVADSAIHAIKDDATA
jgi:predicted dehydrogenase